MSSPFEADMAAVREDMDAAREDLLNTISSLPDEALDRARRGGWTVRRVLQHIIESDWGHARLVAELRGLSVTRPAEARGAPESLPDAVRRLATVRQAVLGTLDGIDEESFYRLGVVGQQEYSVISALENAAHHDREHAQQIRSILASG